MKGFDFLVDLVYCHGIGCWELFPHMLLSKDIFDWNGLYSISWSLLPPPVNDIVANAWKILLEEDFSGMFIFELIWWLDGRTIVEPDDDEDDEDEGGGEAKPLLNMELFRNVFGLRWPTIFRGGAPVNCIGGGCCCCCWGKGLVGCCNCWYFCVGNDDRLKAPLLFIGLYSDVIISEIRSRFHQKSLLNRVIHALSSRNKYRSKYRNKEMEIAKFFLLPAFSKTLQSTSGSPPIGGEWDVNGSDG